MSDIIRIDLGFALIFIAGIITGAWIMGLVAWWMHGPDKDEER